LKLQPADIMFFYYRLSNDRPDKAPPTSQKIPSRGNASPCHASNKDTHGSLGVVAAVVHVLCGGSFLTGAPRTIDLTVIYE
jgi:hypothetical protein